MTYADGSTFEGEWRADNRHSGTFIQKGVKYQPILGLSNFKNEKMHGSGKITWTSGANYSGQWREGKRNGKGKMNYADGSSFNGTWLNDTPVSGTMKWPSGAKFRGKINSSKSQIAEYTMKDGSFYVGGWKNNVRVGQGRMVYANGDTYEGRYKHNQREGQGTFTW